MGRQRHAASLPLADADPAQDRRFVTALARGLTVLRCFGPADRWLAHPELAHRTGLPDAQHAHALTQALDELGCGTRADVGENNFWLTLERNLRDLLRDSTLSDPLTAIGSAPNRRQTARPSSRLRTSASGPDRNSSGRT